MPGTEKYKSITIVGVGLIGGSLAMALRKRGFEGRIRGVSRPEPIEEALSKGLIDEGFGYQQLAEAVSGSQLVVLATPISRIIELIAELGEVGEALAAGTVITDVGSTKEEIMQAAAASLPDSVHFIGGHPLAGSEERGVQASDPLLFENAIYVLTPPGGSEDSPEVKQLGDFIALTGARVMVLTPAKHDLIAAAISPLPQILAVELVNSLADLGDDSEKAIHLAAGGFRDMTRIASSPFSIWKDILASNSVEIRNLLENFNRRLSGLLESFDVGGLEENFQQARELRSALPRDTKGFLSRLWDLRVVVEDRPGMIADISGHLHSKGLNIKDMSVVKVREGETGSVRIAFGTREQALEALAELEEAGYQARLRE